MQGHGTQADQTRQGTSRISLTILLNTLLCLGTLLCVYLVMVIYGYIAAVSVRTMLTSACMFVLVLTWYYSRFWPKARLETLTNARGT